MSTRRNILFVIPHQDDLEFGMGGTAYLLKDKYKLTVCLVLGQEASYMRMQEQEAACRMLGADLVSLKRTELFADKATCEEVAEVMRRLDPVAVFGMWPLDVHPDHSASSEITRRAMHMADVNPEFYMFEGDFAVQTVRFDPDIFVDITSVIEAKKELLLCHKSQNTEQDLVEKCMSQFFMRGQQAHCRPIFYRKEEDIAYAEGFKTLRPVTSNRECILFGL